MFDIFMIFLDTTKQLQYLQDFMNHLHPTINFTFQQFNQQLSFLDMKINIKADSPQHCTKNSLTAWHFYTSIPTSHSSTKKASFSHKHSNTTSATSPSLSSAPMTLFSTNPPRHQVQNSPPNCGPILK